MGTATIQGALWGARARDWATYGEGVSRPLFEAVLQQLRVGPGTRLLDVGCGAGLAAQLAAQRGAEVTGLDAAAALIEIARERVPAGDFRVGELEELPYPDHRFDAVTGFNAFQYAANPVTALAEARRVVRPEGQVVMAVWGQAEDCEMAPVLAAVGRLLPPPPPGAGGPFALSAPGRLEALMAQAGLQPLASGEVVCPFEHPDLETALRGNTAAGPNVRAIQHAGEAAVRQALADALARFRTPDGGYRLRNTFRYVITTPAG